MKSVIKVLCLFILSTFAYSVNAATINGSFGINGSLDTDAADGDTLADITEITLSNVFGSGVSDGNTSNVTFLSANMTPGTSASLTSFSPVSGFMSIEGWSLELTSLSIVDQTTSQLTLSGTGILTGGEYNPTNASWSFSTSSLDSYSMTIAAVPVPAAVWLFGSGLIGLVGIARRKA